MKNQSIKNYETLLDLGCPLAIEKNFCNFKAEGQKYAKCFITWTFYKNSERSEQFLSASSLASASLSPFVLCFLSLILFVTIRSVCHNMQCLLQFVLIVIMICRVCYNLQCLSQFFGQKFDQTPRSIFQVN